MMQEQFSGSQLSQRQIRAQQILILAQMVQFATQAKHIDELFLWLCQNIVRGFGIPVAQIWIHTSRSPADTYIELRTSVSNDSTLPDSLMTNQHVVEVARTSQHKQNRHNGQQRMQVEPVHLVFSPHQAALLKRYGLTHLSTSFLLGNILLPPTAGRVERQQALPVPQAITVLLFLQQIPSDSLLSAISSLLEQLLPVAYNQGLLSTPTTLAPPPQAEPDLPLSHLIARRVRNNAQNPLAEATNISDKLVRRFYAAVDGRKTIAELAMLLRIDTKETNNALHTLLNQHLIQLYDRKGNSVSDPHTF